MLPESKTVLPSRSISNVIGIAPEKVECDMRVEVAYQPISEKITLPKFKPIA